MSQLIYFAGSICGGRQDVKLYASIIKQLQAYGTVLTEHVGSDSETDKLVGSLGSDKAIHDRDIEWLKTCDVLIAEVTQPSLGVGYELGRAVAMNKRILCLFRPNSGKNLSSMIAGADDGNKVTVQNYEEHEVPNILKEFFK